MTVDACSWRFRLLLPLQFAAFGVVLFGLKLWLIHTYGNETPFWDQWDAEAARLYDPFLNGRLRWRDLTSAHNEHRILATRLLGLLLLRVNGLWSPMLEMVVNAGLHVAALTLTVWLIGKTLGQRFVPAMLMFALFVFGIPYAWENTLSGFQSQFYFVLLFSVLAMWLLVASQPLARWWWVGILASVAAYFSLASGVFAIAAAVTTLLFRFALVSRDWRELLAAVLLSALFAIGVWNTPTVVGHAAHRAADVQQLLDALGSALAWPTMADWPLVGLLVLMRNWPGLLLAGLMTWKRPNRADPLWFLFALGVWLAGQAVSIAYGRADDVLSSRYLDLLAMGLLVNFAALVVLFDRAAGRRQLLLAIAGLAWLCFVATPLAEMASNELPAALAGKRASSAGQESNLAAYLATSDLPALRRVPFLQSPYPDADRLAAILEQPGVRTILPRNLRAPLDMAAMEQTEGDAFVPGGAYTSTPDCRCGSWGSWGPAGDRAAGVALMRYDTPASSAGAAFFEIKIAGYPSKVGGVELVQGSTVTPLVPAKDPGEAWTTQRFSAKPGPFYLRVTDKSATAWVAVGRPVAMGQVDAVIASLLENWSRFCGVGVALACLALMLGGGAGPANMTFAVLGTLAVIAADRATSALLSTAMWYLVILGLPMGAGALFAIRRHGLTEPIQLALWSVAFSGTCAYLAFWGYFYAPIVGQLLAGAIMVLCAFVAGKLWASVTVSDVTAFRKVALPFFVSALFAFVLLALAQNEITDPLVAMRTRFSHPLPVDNELPLIFANDVRAGRYPSPMIGNWLGSDRPPLQSAYFLMSNPLFAEDARLSYQVMGTMLQCWWVIGLWLLLAAFDLPRRLVAGAMATAMASGVAIVHGVFVWPKLLPVLPLALITAFLLTGARERMQDWRCGFAVGCNAAVAMLCHGGSAFALLGIGLAALMFRALPSPRFLASAVAGALLLLLPWSTYQHFFDPPGDRLLKWHLAGVVEPDTRTMGEALRAAYAAMPLGGILSNKLANVQALLGEWFDWGGILGRVLACRASEADLRSLRYAQFFNLFASLGLFAAAPLLLLFKRRAAASMVGAKLMGVSGLIACIWVALMYGPGETFVHQGSLALPLFMLAGGFLLIAGLSAWLSWLVLAGHAVVVGVVYFSGSAFASYGTLTAGAVAALWMVSLGHTDMAKIAIHQRLPT